MIDVAKCLEALRDYRRFGFGMICGPDKKVAVKDVIEVIEGLEDHLREVTKMVPKWISVEERLPEISDIVLVIANGKPRENITLHNAFLMASYWGEEGWIADGFEGWDALQVTHWMPLPEPPKEE